MPAGQKYQGIAFIKWTAGLATGQPEMNMLETGYYLSWSYDYGNNIDYSKLFLLQENRLQMVVNDPDQSTYYDLFLTLNNDNDLLTTEISAIYE